MSKALFITATGTDVGKTFVSALLVQKLHQAGLQAGYYKPALSGLDMPVPSDVEYVKQVSSITQSLESMVSYAYNKAVSPHLAAQLEGNPLEISIIRQRFEELTHKYEYLTVEGCGGIVCPMRYDDKPIFLTDIIHSLKLSTVVVTNAALGSINSTILTVEYLRQQNICVQGLIINNYDNTDILQNDNKKMIEQLSKLPVLVTVAPHAQTIDIELSQLIQLYN